MNDCCVKLGSFDSNTTTYLKQNNALSEFTEDEDKIARHNLGITDANDLINPELLQNYYTKDELSFDAIINNENVTQWIDEKIQKIEDSTINDLE